MFSNVSLGRPVLPLKAGEKPTIEESIQINNIIRKMVVKESHRLRFKCMGVAFDLNWVNSQLGVNALKTMRVGSG